MKNITVILLAVFSVAFASYAEAAKPKKRTRNANRVGAYGIGYVGQSRYTGDQSANEAQLAATISDSGAPFQNLSSSTEDTDLGYNATFGFRFNRYFAAELALAQYGSVVSRARADMDFGTGFVPVGLKLSFAAGGPVMSAIGVLPVNDQFEFFGRAGYLFASAERELSSRVDGQSGGFGSAKGDSQNLVLGVGAHYHFNQVYSVRLEYQQIDGIGDEARSGEEDLKQIGLGLVVRF